MQSLLDDTLIYCNRERTRKCERYARKHKCSFLEAYNILYKTNYKYTYEEKLERLSLDTSLVNNR